MFKLVSDFEPAGDQPQAIKQIKSGISSGEEYQTLLGVTGSGKTFTLANAISNFDRPVLIISHNKTLAAQLYSEFKSFFPDNAVEYFVSYYDYYLPEAYIPQTDTYIAKDASINENIEKLRLAASTSLIERKDVIVIASVSCIYGLGSPEDFETMCVKLEIGESISRNEVLHQLINIQYERNDMAPDSGQFRVRGDSVDIYSPQKDEFTRIEFWGDEIENITKCNKVTGNCVKKLDCVALFPCRHFVMPKERIDGAIHKIEKELSEQVKDFEQRGLLVEAQRIYQRTMYDIEMMKEIGYCSGIENYSLHLSSRKTGTRPYCLIDFFPKNFITLIDESHATIPQLKAMYKADRSRKQTLVDHGFRLPSALDNRPLQFEEILDITNSTIFVSATPGEIELELSSKPIEQVVRPTGLPDPKITIKPLDGQVDDVIAEIRECSKKRERVIVTTLTKKSAERLSDYLNELDLKVKYLHSGIDALERVKILNELRKGEFDCIIGINLLREGIDIPEVALVAILDADKEGFLRSERSLLQVAGRAARNLNGRVILYADKKTDSILKLLKVTEQRRKIQLEYNKKYKITPRSIESKIKETITDVLGLGGSNSYSVKEESTMYGTQSDTNIDELLTELELEMLEAATAMEFERAADLRDKIKQLTENMDFQ